MPVHFGVVAFYLGISVLRGGDQAGEDNGERGDEAAALRTARLAVWFRGVGPVEIVFLRPLTFWIAGSAEGLKERQVRSPRRSRCGP